MLNKISIIGGDLRTVKLAEMLANDKIEVYSYGLEKAGNIIKNDNIRKMNSLEDAINSAEIVIGPIPLTSNNIDINTPFSDNDITLEELSKILEDKVFIAGSIKKEIETLLNAKKVIDIMQREELTVLNTISTAEGTIQIAMEETTRTVHGSKVLLMGFGRVSKILANMLNGIGANVFCETTSKVSYSWIKAYGYNPVLLNEIDSELNSYDIIINTIPEIILNEEKLKLVKKDCVIIDLASNPGGVDKIAVKKLGLKFIWALSLPGKVAPTTSAEYIKDTLYNIFKELN